MKFLEKLDLSPTQYRIALEEGNLAAIAEAILHYLKTEKEPAEVMCLTALELCPILLKVGGEDARWFQKMATKLKKLSSKAPH